MILSDTTLAIACCRWCLGNRRLGLVLYLRGKRHACLALHREWKNELRVPRPNPGSPPPQRRRVTGPC